MQHHHNTHASHSVPPPPQQQQAHMHAPHHLVIHAAAAATAGGSSALPPNITQISMCPQQAPQASSSQQHAGQTQQQQQQQQTQHINNVVPPTVGAPTQSSAVAITTIQHNQHNRLNNHHQQQQQQSSMRTSPQQLQKLRQQHQYMNNGNTNNNNNTKTYNYNNQQQQQQQQQQPQPQRLRQQSYNQTNIRHSQHIGNVRNVSHVINTQQQQNQHHHHHHPQHANGMNNNNNNNNNKQGQNQHQSYINNDNNITHATTHQQHYTATKSCDATNDITPKIILQNPNRLSLRQKSQMPHATTSIAEGAAKTAGTTTISTDGKVENSTPIVSAANSIDADDVIGVIVSDASKGTETLRSNDNILPNEDSSAAKNSKEKTPMCLVNELARYNKITHQYRLTSEKGPAHSKLFTVTLKLGDEEYSADGFKIKKAQHLAAAEAIAKTKYKHPVPKINRRPEGIGSSRSFITPTVELNALAMKLGQQTYYLYDSVHMPPTDVFGPPPPPSLPLSDGMMPPFGGGTPLPPMGGQIIPSAASYRRFNGGHSAAVGAQQPPPPPPPPHMPPYPPPPPPPQNQRFCFRGYPPKFRQLFPFLAQPTPPGAFPPPSAMCKITLVVGKHRFTGTGRTVQRAKHDAASRALQVLKAQATTELNEALNQSLEDGDSKSPISLVHEIGIKRNMTVHFKVLREEGLPHMKNFITACIVGTLVTEGEGNGKKISRKRAAEKMLIELKKLPPLSPTKSPVRRIRSRTPGKGAGSSSSTVTSANATATAATAATSAAAGGGGGVKRHNAADRRKRSSASIKEKSDDDTNTSNPVTKLIQIQQSHNEKEPVFELIAKSAENSRRCDFIMEVSAQGLVARGTGNSKKIAKRNAAQNLLSALGVEGFPSVSNIQQTDNTSKHTRAKRNENTGIDVLDLTRPGVLILRQNKKHGNKKKGEQQVAISGNTTAATNASDDNAAKAVVDSTKAAAAIETTQVSVENADITTTTTTTNKTTATTNNTANISATTTATNSEADVPAKISTVDASAEAANTTIPAAAPASTTVTKTATPAVNENTATTSSIVSNRVSMHMKEQLQLLYLAKLLGFEVSFSDYPKGNHNEFLTIVTLSTNPPQICHGVGVSSDESQNDAAKNALKILSELGLNNIKDN